MSEEVRVWREAQKIGYGVIEQVMKNKTQEQMAEGITVLRGIAFLILAHDFMNIVEHKLGPNDDFNGYANYVMGCVHDLHSQLFENRDKGELIWASDADVH